MGISVGSRRRTPIEDFPDDVPKLSGRRATPGAFFLEACDGKFTDEDLNDEGNAFAQDYFDFKKGRYILSLIHI